MTARTPSQCDLILEFLSDGQRHDMRAIHAAVGFCRLNSRVSELRKRGHNIVCDPAGGKYVYQLLLPEPEQLSLVAA